MSAAITGGASGLGFACARLGSTTWHLVFESMCKAMHLLLSKWRKKIRLNNARTRIC